MKNLAAQRFLQINFLLTIMDEFMFPSDKQTTEIMRTTVDKCW